MVIWSTYKHAVLYIKIEHDKYIIVTIQRALSSSWQQHFLSFYTFNMQRVSGNLKLLISHAPYRVSTSSEISSRSTYSSSHASSSLFSHSAPIYAEIMAPTGFRIGEHKCIVLRKVCAMLAIERIREGEGAGFCMNSSWTLCMCICNSKTETNSACSPPKLCSL